LILFVELLGYSHTQSQKGILTELVRQDKTRPAQYHAFYSWQPFGIHAAEAAAHQSKDCFGEPPS
jgi:aminoglycoside N3'-acetyltransferase